MSSTLGHFFQIFENPIRRVEHLGTLAGNHAERRRAEALHQSEAGEPTVADLTVIPACAFENRLTPFVGDAEDRAALLVELLFLFICHAVLLQSFAPNAMILWLGWRVSNPRHTD